MIIIGQCLNCNEYYGRKYSSLLERYNDETTHRCKEKASK